MMQRSKKPLGRDEQDYFNENCPVNLCSTAPMAARPLHWIVDTPAARDQAFEFSRRN